MNDLVRLNIHEFTAADEEKVKTVLPKRYERAGRFADGEDRLRCLAGGILLIRHLGLENEDKLLYGEFGKPYLAEGPQFNLAHSGDWAVLAISDKPVGIDIEHIGSRNVRKLARSFPAEEFDWMQSEDALERFYMLWTMKESVMKASGRGLNLDPRSFSVLPAIEGNNLEIDGAAWYPESFVFDDYVIAVCSSQD